MKNILKKLLIEGLNNIIENNEDDEVRYNVIGFANKYFTLWSVRVDKDYAEYQYIKNLSFDFDEAKKKAGTDKYDEKLRGKSKSFITIEYDDDSTQTFDSEDTIVQLSAIMNFGKYKGQNILSVVNKDPDYLAWVALNVTNNPKLVKLIRTLTPVYNILKNSSQFVQAEKNKDIFAEKFKRESVQMFQQMYGLELEWILSNDSTLKSKKMKLTATRQSLQLKLDDKKKYYCSIEFDQIPTKRKINTYLKKEEKLIRYPYIKIDNVDLTQYAKQIKGINDKIFFELANTPDELKNKKYEFTGYFTISGNKTFFTANNVSMI